MVVSRVLSRSCPVIVSPPQYADSTTLSLPCIRLTTLHLRAPLPRQHQHHYNTKTKTRQHQEARLTLSYTHPSAMRKEVELQTITVSEDDRNPILPRGVASSDDGSSHTDFFDDSSHPVCIFSCHTTQHTTQHNAVHNTTQHSTAQHTAQHRVVLCRGNS